MNLTLLPGGQIVSLNWGSRYSQNISNIITKASINLFQFSLFTANSGIESFPCMAIIITSLIPLMTAHISFRHVMKLFSMLHSTLTLRFNCKVRMYQQNDRRLSVTISMPLLLPFTVRHILHQGTKMFTCGMVVALPLWYGFISTGENQVCKSYILPVIIKTLPDHMKCLAGHCKTLTFWHIRY